MTKVCLLLLIVCLVLYSGRTQISVLLLKGSDYSDLGRQYGVHFKQLLATIYNILHDYYVVAKHISLERLESSAWKLYERYKNDNYRRFIQGMAEGAKMPLSKAIIINGMEGLGKLVLGCSYFYVPPEKSTTSQGLIGRNYDFPPPFDTIAQYVSITVLDDEASAPVAFIGFVGEMMCLTCVNANNIFISLNNGMPSGGFEVNEQDPTILGALFDIARTVNQLDKVNSHFPQACRYDYSTILNFANASHVQSFEVSSRSGCRKYTPRAGQSFVSANHFQNETWDSPTHAHTNSWESRTRRTNLEKLLSNEQRLRMEDTLQILDVPLAEGGAKWEPTLFQVAYDFTTRLLYVRRPHFESVWKHIDLKVAFESLGETQLGLTLLQALVMYFIAVLSLVLFLCGCLYLSKPSPKSPSML